MRSLFCALLAGLVPLSVLCTGAFADDVSYTYDAMGRLVRVDYASGPTVVYNYDPAGNRTSVAYGCKKRGARRQLRHCCDDHQESGDVRPSGKRYGSKW